MPDNLKVDNFGTKSENENKKSPAKNGSDNQLVTDKSNCDEPASKELNNKDNNLDEQ